MLCKRQVYMIPVDVLKTILIPGWIMTLGSTRRKINYLCAMPMVVVVVRLTTIQHQHHLSLLHSCLNPLRWTISSLPHQQPPTTPTSAPLAGQANHRHPVHTVAILQRAAGNQPQGRGPSNGRESFESTIARAVSRGNHTDHHKTGMQKR